MKKFFYLPYRSLLYSLFLLVLISGTLWHATASTAAISGPAKGVWPCTGYDARHTGQSPYPGAQTNTLKWTYQLGAWIYQEGDYYYSPPVIGADGTIYIGSAGGTVYAIDLNGGLKWSYQTESAIHSSPTIGTDGTIYVATDNGTVYALDPNPRSDQRVKWALPTTKDFPLYSSPVIGEDGTIYVGSLDGNVYAIDLNGRLKWSYQTKSSSSLIGTGDQIYTKSPIRFSPAIGTDGTIYVVTDDGTVYALDPNNSETRLKWSYSLESYTFFSSPAVGADGTIYISGSNSNDQSSMLVVYAIDLNGSLKWSYEIEYSMTDASLPFTAIPAIAADGTIYIESPEGEVHAINPDGSKKWESEPIDGGEFSGWVDRIYSSPAIGADGMIYIVSMDGSTYALDSDGVLKWRTTETMNDAVFVSNYLLSLSPVIGANKTVYVVSGSSLYAIGYVPPWPCRGHDAQHTGQSSFIGAQNNTLKWLFETKGAVESSAAIGADGTIYIGSNDQNVYAINPNGSLRWKFKTGGEICSSPAISVGGTIYVGSYDGRIYALDPLDPDGNPKWTFPPATGGATEDGQSIDIDDVFSSPAIGDDGTIYIGSESGGIYALDPNGSMKWNFQAEGEAYSSPAISADGSTIYVGSTGGTLYALKSGSGFSPDTRVKWRVQVAGGFYSSPALGTDGTIYVGSSNDNIYALDPNGSRKWSYQMGDDVDSSPAIGTDGTVYVGSDDGKVYALDPNATDPSKRVKWSYQTKGKVWSSPAIGADGTIYIGSNDTENNDGWIYALKPDGSLLWNYHTGGLVTSSAAIAEGLIYIGSDDGMVYAFETLKAPTAESGSPSGPASLRDSHSPSRGGFSVGGCFINSLL
jgi:outer membrane protein assembly factor BamB